MTVTNYSNSSTTNLTVRQACRSEHLLSTKSSSLKRNSTDRTDLRTIFRVAFRTVTSLVIPMTFALFLSLFATFLFHANQNASYFHNAWFLFCKLFFPSTPVMMWFITKK